VTPEEIAESRRHVARMSTAELGQMFGKGADAWPPEAWAILEQEVARRERAARVSRLQTAGGSTADGTAPVKRRFGVLGGALLLFLGLVGVGYLAKLVKFPTALPALRAAAHAADRDAILVLLIVLLILVIYLTPIIWVLASGRSHGGAKFGWFLVTVSFSWVGLAAFLILTQAPKDSPQLDQ